MKRWCKVGANLELSVGLLFAPSEGAESAMSDARIEELVVYPVKGCGGVHVKSANLTPTGLELDRWWCIVDTQGHAVAQFEAISKRKVPQLATINVSVFVDGIGLAARAPDARMKPTASAWPRGLRTLG